MDLIQNGLLCEGVFELGRDDRRCVSDLLKIKPLTGDFNYWIDLPECDYRKNVLDFLQGKSVEIEGNQLFLIVPDSRISEMDTIQNLVAAYVFKKDANQYRSFVRGTVPVNMTVLRDSVKVVKENSYKNRQIGSYKKYRLTFTTRLQLVKGSIPDVSEKDLHDGLSVVYESKVDPQIVVLRAIKAILANPDKIYYCEKCRFLMKKPEDADGWDWAFYLEEFSQMRITVKGLLEYMRLFGSATSDGAEIFQLEFGSRYLLPIGFMNHDGWALLSFNFGKHGDGNSQHAQFCQNAHKAASFLSNQATFFLRQGKIRDFHFKEDDWSIKFTKFMNGANPSGWRWDRSLVRKNSNFNGPQKSDPEILSLAVEYLTDCSRLLESIACFMERSLNLAGDNSPSDELYFRQNLAKFVMDSIKLDPLSCVGCDNPVIDRYAHAILNGFN